MLQNDGVANKNQLFWQDKANLGLNQDNQVLNQAPNVRQDQAHPVFNQHVNQGIQQGLNEPMGNNIGMDQAKPLEPVNMQIALPGMLSFCRSESEIRLFLLCHFNNHSVVVLQVR